MPVEIIQNPIIKPDPCPFCGSTEVEVQVEKQMTSHPIVVWHVCHCRSCGADGPRDLGESGAVASWNQRFRKGELLCQQR